jgi:flagellin-like protein
MFEDKTDRGQVGIGTLIVFIAMVLVAAIAAGVLVNTAGFLQENAEQTGQESQAQVSDRLQVVSAVATDDASDGYDSVTFLVKRSAGSDDIALDEVTVSWIDDQNSAVTHTVATGEVNAVSGSGTTISSDSDRFEIAFDLGSAPWGTQLQAGDEVSVEFTTASGAVTVVEGKIPSTATSGEPVEL